MDTYFFYMGWVIQWCKGKFFVFPRFDQEYSTETYFPCLIEAYNYIDEEVDKY